MSDFSIINRTFFIKAIKTQKDFYLINQDTKLKLSYFEILFLNLKKKNY